MRPNESRIDPIDCFVRNNSIFLCAGIQRITYIRNELDEYYLVQLNADGVVQFRFNCGDLVEVNIIPAICFDSAFACDEFISRKF